MRRLEAAECTDMVISKPSGCDDDIFPHYYQLIFTVSTLNPGDVLGGVGYYFL